ncbi:hypothetical protein MTR67_002170 [Solanum verrucosum]|uniref:Retrotransposon gag domain-containing protein n=1 Tax=Solanum verrucosum TaxID=315347 RepID=A0AAF0TD28_SOLVR|nr:hypothetical protein MTR67_002170 [Solanum verrucosum]
MSPHVPRTDTYYSFIPFSFSDVMYGLRPNHFSYDVLDDLMRLMLDFRFVKLFDPKRNITPRYTLDHDKLGIQSARFRKDMAPQRAYIWSNLNENVEREAPQALQEAPQVPINPLAEKETNAEFRADFQLLAQANIEVMVPMNPNGGSEATRAKLATYQLKGVAHVLFNQWKEERAVDVGPLDWKKCKGAFLYRFFPHYRREANEMDISNLMIHAQQLEEEKLKEKSREENKAKSGVGDFSHSRFDGHGRSKFQKMFSGQGSSNASAPKFSKERVSNPKPQGGNGSSVPA